MKKTHIPLILILILLFPDFLFSATITVGDGKTHATIQAAVNAASCGDVIDVYSGTYEEKVVTTQDCTSGNELTIEGAGGESVTVNAFDVDHSYHKFKNFTVTGTSAPSFEIKIGISYIEISGNTFPDIVTAGNAAINFPGGVGMETTNHFTISDNVFGPATITDSYCIKIRGHDHLISNNTFNYWNGHDAIDYLAKDTTISDNTFNNISHSPDNGDHPDCIQVLAEEDTNVDGAIIERNIFKNCNGQIIRTTADSGQTTDGWNVRNNIIVNAGAKAIQCTGDSFLVYNNTLYLATRNTDHPIGFRAAGAIPENTNSEIKNNIVIGCGSDPSSSTKGMFNLSDMTETEGFAHSNNYFADDKKNSYGSKTITEDGVVNGGNPYFTNVNNWWTIISDNGGAYGGGSGVDVTTIEVRAADIAHFDVGEYISIAPFLTGNDTVARQITDITGNVVTFTPAISSLTPVEYDTDTNDYNVMILLWGSNTNCIIDTSLTGSSPAINAGTNLSGTFTDDYNGNTRIAPWDIGAYEYITGINNAKAKIRSLSGGINVKSLAGGGNWQ